MTIWWNFLSHESGILDLIKWNVFFLCSWPKHVANAFDFIYAAGLDVSPVHKAPGNVCKGHAFAVVDEVVGRPACQTLLRPPHHTLSGPDRPSRLFKKS